MDLVGKLVEQLLEQHTQPLKDQACHGQAQDQFLTLITTLVVTGGQVKEPAVEQMSGQTVHMVVAQLEVAVQDLCVLGTRDMVRTQR